MAKRICVSCCMTSVVEPEPEPEAELQEPQLFPKRKRNRNRIWNRVQHKLQ